MKIALSQQITYGKRKFHTDEEGRVIEAAFVDVKRDEYIAFMQAFETLWIGSGLLPKELSDAISHMEAAVKSSRMLVDSRFGITRSGRGYRIGDVSKVADDEVTS